MDVKPDAMTNAMCEATAITRLSDELARNTVKVTISHASASFSN